MSATPKASMTGSRRSGRIASITPAPIAPSSVSSRRPPTKKAEGTAAAAVPNTNLNSIAEGALPVSHSVLNGMSAVDAVGLKLEPQQVLNSYAYGSKGRSAKPTELRASTRDKNAADEFAAAVNETRAKSRSPSSSPPPPEQAAPTVEAVAGSPSNDAVARRRRGGGSQAGLESASAYTTSSGRSTTSLASLNAIVVSFAGSDGGAQSVAASGSRSQTDRNSPSRSPSGSPSRGSGSSSRSSPSRSDDAAAAGPAPVHAPHAVPSGLRPSVPAWFTPLVWLLALFNKVAVLAAMAGSALKQVTTTILHIVKALLPLLLVLGLLAGAGHFAVHSDVSGKFVSSIEHLSPPYTAPSVTWMWPSFSSPSFSSGVTDKSNDSVGNAGNVGPLVPSLGNILTGKSASPPPAKASENKINFLAPATGVAIDPYLTSHSRPLARDGSPLPVPRRSWVSRLLRRPISRFPRYGPGPASCLHDWDDAGECWCGPELNHRAQIGIVLAQPVIPQELVVEHIESKRITAGAQSATIKDFEMWVQIEDKVMRQEVESAAMDVVDELSASDAAEPSTIHDEVGAARKLDQTWVRVGRWQYQHGGSAAQTFAIPVDLAHYKLGVHNMVVRTTSSWGDGNDSVCIYRLKLHGLSPDDLAAAAV